MEGGGSRAWAGWDGDHETPSETLKLLMAEKETSGTHLSTYFLLSTRLVYRRILEARRTLIYIRADTNHRLERWEDLQGLV